MYKKFGDWGLGIGDWAQSPIPNPQSPLYKKYINNNDNINNNNNCYKLINV